MAIESPGHVHDRPETKEPNLEHSWSLPPFSMKTLDKGHIEEAFELSRGAALTYECDAAVRGRDGQRVALRGHLRYASGQPPS